MPAISLSNLVFCYAKGDFVLSCPSLDFPRGELRLIMGANGSGKTLSKPAGSQSLAGRCVIFESQRLLYLGQIGRTSVVCLKPEGKSLQAQSERDGLCDELLGRDSKPVPKEPKIIGTFWFGSLEGTQHL